MRVSEGYRFFVRIMTLLFWLGVTLGRLHLTAKRGACRTEQVPFSATALFLWPFFLMHFFCLFCFGNSIGFLWGLKDLGDGLYTPVILGVVIDDKKSREKGVMKGRRCFYSRGKWFFIGRDSCEFLKSFRTWERWKRLLRKYFEIEDWLFSIVFLYFYNN